MMFQAWKIALIFTVVRISSPSMAGVIATEYQLDASFSPEGSWMEAVATVSLSQQAHSSGPIAFYIHGESFIDSVILNGEWIRFGTQQVLYHSDYSLVATRVTFTPPAENDFVITVYYEAAFHSSVARSILDRNGIDVEGVFLKSFGQSLWFPVFLEENDRSYEVDFSEVTLRIPEGYTAVFVGEKLSEEIVWHERVSKWRSLRTELADAFCNAMKWVVNTQDDITVYSLPDSASVAVGESYSKLATEVLNRYEDAYRSSDSFPKWHILQLPHYQDFVCKNVIGVKGSAWSDFGKAGWQRDELAKNLVRPFVNIEIGVSDSLYALASSSFQHYFHLPVLIEMVGGDWYDLWLLVLQSNYLKRVQWKIDHLSRPLPEEKPITQIAASEIDSYEGKFLLNDRGILFLHWIYLQMGPGRFFDFSRELFGRERISYGEFCDLIVSYLPSSRDDIAIWLSTTEFPERFMLKRAK